MMLFKVMKINAKHFHSIFDFMNLLKMTGASATKENKQSIIIEVHEKAKDELVIL